MPSDELDVFISSDISEFKIEREHLSNVICEIPFCTCIPLEKRGAETTDVVAASLKATRNCDVYIGIFGRSYSDTTIKEYKEAVRLHKACLCYVKKIDRSAELTEFIGNTLTIQFKYHEFKGRKDLYTQVESDLRKLIFEMLKDGLRYRESEKTRAIQIIATERKPAFPVSSTGEQMARAQRAYNEGTYMECVVQSSILLEHVLRERLKDKRMESKRMSLGQLVRLTTDAGIVDKNLSAVLLEISYVRNAVVHGMQTIDRKTALWILNGLRKVLLSLKE